MDAQLFQQHLRAIYDGVLRRAVESREQMHRELGALIGQLGGDDVPLTEEFSRAINEEVVRFHESLRAAEQASQRAEGR